MEKATSFTSDMGRLAPSGTLCILAPHPDDETLGCGGLIALAVKFGRKVLVVVVTDGSASHPNVDPDRLIALRADELKRGLAALGVLRENLVELGSGDGRLCDLDPDDIADQLASVIAGRDVQTLFSPSSDDLHPDHRAVFNASMILAKRLDLTLWTYPIRAYGVERAVAAAKRKATLDVSSVLAKKRAAIAAHKTQLGDYFPDDAQGFSLTDADIQAHTQPFEVFILEHSMTKPVAPTRLTPRPRKVNRQLVS